MQSESSLESDIDTTSPIGKKGRSKNMKIMFWLHAVTFLLGLSLLVYLVYYYWDQVKVAVVNVGFGFFIIVALNLLRHLLRSASMYLAIHPERRTFSYRSAVAARFGGEAVTFFTFTGPFLGDATKAVLLRNKLPLTHGASAIILDNLLYYISVTIVVLSGIATLLYLHESNSDTLNKVLFATVVVAVVMFAVLIAALAFRVKPFSWVVDVLEKRNWLPGFIARREHHLLEIENNVFEFYNTRRADFFLIFSISMVVHAVGVLEVYVVLRLLGYEALVANAFIIESLTKVINAVFGFIPGTVGAYEGGNGIILKILGYPTTGFGVALALVRRGAILVSTAIGMIILLWRTAEHGSQQLNKKS